MVDLSSIGKNLHTDALNAAAASQANEDIKKAQKKPVNFNKGLGLQDIPEKAPYVNVSDVEDITDAEEVTSTEYIEGEEILDKVDNELKDVQEFLKKVIAKKIKLADKHDDKKHELLVSAFNDCKKAYAKLQEVRGTIS
jgi:hypothetical protein